MATNDGSVNVPTVVILGAGAAGIFTAYQINKQYPGQFNIQLYESNEAIGGNVSSLTVNYGAEQYIIDAGAQFFYAKAQPNYFNLIQELGLGDEIPLYPAGLTIWEKSKNDRLLWIPALVSGFSHYNLEDWIRLIEFGEFLVAATLLNCEPDWTLSVDDWLAKSMPLVSNDFKQNVIKNFLYQFVSLPYANIGEASAVYATTYFVRNVFGGQATTASTTLDTNIPTFQTNQSLIGLLGILEQALTVSGVSVHTSSPVTSVAPSANGVDVTVNGNTIHAQYVIMACDPGASAKILNTGGTAPQELINLLQGLANYYLDLTIVIQKDGACWIPDNKSYWESVNTIVDTPKQSVTFNAWFGPLRPPYNSNQLIPVFKSWATPNLNPDDCSHAFFSHIHNVLLPTTTFIELRSQLDTYQGQNGLLFAGGWTNWFDSQEAALMSAINVTNKLQPQGAVQQRYQPLDEYNSGIISGQVKSWLEMVQQLPHTPELYKNKLAELVKKLG